MVRFYRYPNLKLNFVKWKRYDYNFNYVALMLAKSIYLYEQ